MAAVWRVEFQAGRETSPVISKARARVMDKRISDQANHLALKIKERRTKTVKMPRVLTKKSKKLKS